MKRKLFTLFTIFLLLLTLPLSVLADEVPPLVVDNAGLLTEEERMDLIYKSLTTLREEYQMDVVILTVSSLEGKSPQRYADDFYDQNGYGYPNDGSGVLFLLSMEERDWYISTYGDAIYALTNYGIQSSAEEALPYFANGDFYNGFTAWLDVLTIYFEAFKNGEPIDVQADYSESYYPADQEIILHYENNTPNFFLSLVIGLVVAGVTIIVMRSGMKTNRAQTGAVNYIAEGSYHLRTHQDMYLYSNITKTPRPKDKSSGGGSSVHTSSRGRSHGGGGGKF